MKMNNCNLRSKTLLIMVLLFIALSFAFHLYKRNLSFRFVHKELHASNTLLIENFRKEHLFNNHASEEFNDSFMEDKQKVRQEILRMADLDQKVRVDVWEKVTETCQKEHLDCTNDYQAVYDVTNEVDQMNIKTLRTFMQKYVWFKISDFDLVTAQNAWLIVQHADIDLQIRVLFIMQNLLDSGEVDPQNYALLYDRVSLEYKDFGIKQRYGSQFALSSDHQELVFEPCEGKLQEIDKRRKQMGLNSLRENAKMLAEMNHITKIVGLPE